MPHAPDFTCYCTRLFTHQKIVRIRIGREHLKKRLRVKLGGAWFNLRDVLDATQKDSQEAMAAGE